MLGDDLDRAVLAGGVAALQHDHRALARLHHRLLEVDQPELQFVAAVLVAHPLNSFTCVKR